MDDNDKIRRNLVVFSSAVIYASWIGITIDKPAIDFFTSSIKVNLPSKNTLWSGTIFLLLYFLFRFIKAKENIDDYSNRKTSRQKRFTNSVFNLLKREIKTGEIKSFVDTESKIASHNSVTVNDIAQFVKNSALQINKITVSAENTIEPNGIPLTYGISISVRDPISSDLLRLREERAMDFAGSAMTESGTYKNSEDGDVYFQMTWAYHRILEFRPTKKTLYLCRIRGYFRWLVDTEYGLLYIFPICLGCLALISSTCILLSIYFTSAYHFFIVFFRH